MLHIKRLAVGFFYGEWASSCETWLSLLEVYSNFCICCGMGI